MSLPGSPQQAYHGAWRWPKVESIQQLFHEVSLWQLPGPSQTLVQAVWTVGDITNCLECVSSSRGFHENTTVCRGHAELPGGDFRNVSEIGSLLTELAPSVINPVNATNQQPLLVEFWDDSQTQVHARLLVVGKRRLGHNSPWDEAHRGSSRH